MDEQFGQGVYTSFSKENKKQPKLHLRNVVLRILNDRDDCIGKTYLTKRIHLFTMNYNDINVVLKDSTYEKEEILEFYVNGIYYGSGYYSIYDAAKGYFNKEPEALTDYECTLLVGIPNAPSVYSLNNRPDLAKQRQEKVIECMVDVEYITQEERNNILGK